MTTENFIEYKLSTQFLKFQCSENINNLTKQEHHLIKKHQIDSFEKLNSREFYNILSILKEKKIQFSKIVRKTFSKLQFRMESYLYPTRLIQSFAFFSTNECIINILTISFKNLENWYHHLTLFG